MRYFIFILILSCSLSVKAQNYLPYSGIASFPHWPALGNGIASDSNQVGRQWQLTKFAGISTGISSFHGGSNSFLYAPVGIQATRKLNNHWYAFAAASVGPSYFNFNQPFTGTGWKQNYNCGTCSSSYLGLNTRVEAGLLYMNEAKTFSISGSIRMDRSSRPLYAPYQQQPASNSHPKFVP